MFFCFCVFSHDNPGQKGDITLCNLLYVLCVCVFQSLGLAHFIWITPLQCILCTGLIWELIEVNGLCALAALTLLGIVQAWLSMKMGPHRWGNIYSIYIYNCTYKELKMNSFHVRCCEQGEASRTDQPPPGSDLRDRGEHSLCEGVRLGGGDGDHH